MSFDIFLSRFDNGELAAAPKAPVLDALKRREYEGPDDFGFYRVTVGPDDTTELSARGLESPESFSGCAFHLRRLSEGAVGLIFDIAVAGRLAIVPAMDENPVIVVDRGMIEDLPADMREHFAPALVATVEELGQVLSGGFSDWAKYRDQVIGR